METFWASCFVVLLIIVGFSFLTAWIFMLLWNWLIPIFWNGCPILGYWEAYGVVFLISMIGNFFRSHNSK